MIKHFCVILLLYICAKASSSQKIVGCYWGAWTSIDQIDISLCTHAYFAFYVPDSNGALSTESSLVSSFLALKRKNPSVKLLASIGGGGAGTASFSPMASNPSSRSNFVSNCVALTDQGFDGVDIDWEFPGINDKQSFVDLLAVLKSALSPKGKLLAAAVNSDAWQISQSYIIPDVCRHLDLINLMTYDFIYPITATETNTGYSKADKSADNWISAGCSPSKIALGLSTYGYVFTLANPSNNGVGASVSENTARDISYRDICSNLKSPRWTTSRSDQTPYSYKDTEWITYDDVASLITKLNIVSARSMAGAFFWSTDLDDYDNSCQTGYFPLISSVSEALGVRLRGAQTTPKTSTPKNFSIFNIPHCIRNGCK